MTQHRVTNMLLGMILGGLFVISFRLGQIVSILENMK